MVMVKKAELQSQRLQAGRHAAGVLLGLTVAVAGCAEHPQPRPEAHTTIQSFAGAPADEPTDAGNRVKTNLPSAPADTPLCSAALREQANTGASLYDRSLNSGNSCTRNACFQPLTGTFIAQDGTNSVCR